MTRRKPAAFALALLWRFERRHRPAPDRRFQRRGRLRASPAAARTVDFSLSKSTRIGERLDVQFRAEAFNALNRTQLWMPNTGFGSLDFGRITASRQTVLPRVTQFAIKLKFWVSS